MNKDNVVYVVQSLVDIDYSYNGLDDTGVELFYDKEEAISRIKELYREAIKELVSDYGKTEEDIDTYYDETNHNFYANDGNDYYSGRVIEMKIK